MAMQSTVSITITEENTRVTSVSMVFPFGGELHVAVNYETRHLLEDGSTYSIRDAGQYSRGPDAKDDTITMGGQTWTFQQWMQAGEKFFDQWYVEDHAPPPEPPSP